MDALDWYTLMSGIPDEPPPNAEPDGPPSIPAFYDLCPRCGAPLEPFEIGPLCDECDRAHPGD